MKPVSNGFSRQRVPAGGAAGWDHLLAGMAFVQIHADHVGFSEVHAVSCDEGWDLGDRVDGDESRIKPERGSARRPGPGQLSWPVSSATTTSTLRTNGEAGGGEELHSHG